MTDQLSWIVRLLTRWRDLRIVWDVMGSVYNRRIYDAIAELYAYIAGDLPVPGRACILDVGAGRGYMSLLLAVDNPEARIMGIDYSRMQVREAENFRRKRKIGNCSFRQGNAMSIKFDDDTFDAAVSVGSIKHWSDAHRGLTEIRRVLKPGGCLMIAETDREASDDALREFIRRFRLNFVPDCLFFWGLRHVVFGQSFSEKSLADAVGKAGFRDIECRRTAACPYVMVKAWK